MRYYERCGSCVEVLVDSTQHQSRNPRLGSATQYIEGKPSSCYEALLSLTLSEWGGGLMRGGMVVEMGHMGSRPSPGSSEEEKPLLSIVARIVRPETEPGKRVCTF